jgi:hypothetical protein
MKLAVASLFFAAPAMAFAPTASFGVRSALKMSAETETEEKVSEIFGKRTPTWKTYDCDNVYLLL